MSRKENPFEKEREEYEQIEIPDELRYLVKKTIMQDKKRRQEKRRSYIMRSVASVAALLFLTLTIGVNSSYAFSKKVSKMPVVKSVAKVLTVRKYTAEKAADEELQKELAAQENPEPVAEVVVEEVIPEEAVQETQAETTDVPVADEEVLLAGYEKWASELTLEKLDQVTEHFVIEESSDEIEDNQTEETVEETKQDTASKETENSTTVTDKTTEDAEQKTATTKEAVTGSTSVPTKESTVATTPEPTKEPATTKEPTVTKEPATTTTPAPGASQENDKVGTEAETEQKFKTEEITDTILLAELPKENIRLYGYHENGAVRGVALRIEDTFTCFDWTYLDERNKLPELSYSDADKDGEKEILVFLYNGGKTTEEVATVSGNDTTDAEEKAADETVKQTEQPKQETEASKQITGTTKPTTEETKQETEDTKQTTEETKSESEKSSDTVTLSDNNPVEDTIEKKSLDDVSEIWMVSVSEDGMQPELVSREDEESPILIFIKKLFEK